MRTTRTLDGVIVASLMTAVLALLAAVPDARAGSLDDVLFGIGQVETGGRDVGLHKDGVSYGQFGVTYVAVRELQRVRLLNDKDVDLQDPATNRKVAGLYLEYLHSRHGSWEKAVAKYNPMARDYAPRVLAIIASRTPSAAAPAEAK